MAFWACSGARQPFLLAQTAFIGGCLQQGKKGEIDLFLELQSISLEPMKILIYAWIFSLKFI